MDEARVRELFPQATAEGLTSDVPYVSWRVMDDTAILDDLFTVEQLEALVWWIRTHRSTESA